MARTDTLRNFLSDIASELRYKNDTTDHQYRPRDGFELAIERMVNPKFVTSLVIPPSVTSIRNHEYSGCTNLRSITIPFTGLGPEDWYFWKIFGSANYFVPENLSEVIITNQKVIRTRTFWSCSGVKSITLPDDVTEIEDQAFLQCGVEQMVIPDSVETFGQGMLQNCENMETLTIPRFSADDSETYWYAIGAHSVKHITLTKATKVCDNCFKNLNTLHTISFLDDITYIGVSAFYETRLREMIIPNTVTYIGSNAFQGNVFHTITVPASVGLMIGTEAFCLCYYLETAVVLNSAISSGQFRGCRDLKEVYISKAVTTILSNAFYDDNALTDVYYSGTEEEWQQIDIESTGNGPLLSATMHYNHTFNV